jgi:DNA-binding transcriptional LysR family regulator
MSLNKFNLEKIFVFYNVVKAGSYKLAENKIGIKSSAISKSIKQLEKDLNITLMTRTKSGINLTPQGEILFSLASEILPKLRSVEQYIKNDESIFRGRLTISCFYGIAEHWLIDKLCKMREAYPNLLVNILADNKLLKFEDYQADICIRPFIENRPDLIQTPIYQLQFYLYGAKDYLKKHGEPKSFEDLSHHKLLSTSQYKFHIQEFANEQHMVSDWHLHEYTPKGASNLEPFLIANSTACIVKYIREGIGLGTAPKNYEYLMPNAIRLFKDYEPKPLNLFLYTQSISRMISE